MKERFSYIPTYTHTPHGTDISDRDQFGKRKPNLAKRLCVVGVGDECFPKK